MAAKDFDTSTYWLDVVLQQVRDSRMAPPRAAYCFAAPLIAGFIAANAVALRRQAPIQKSPMAPRLPRARRKLS